MKSQEPSSEESPFGKIKLKKAETVKRTWEDQGMETVDLKHHEFERPPQDEEPEGQSSVTLGTPFDTGDTADKPAKKKKKKKAAAKEETSEESPMEESEPEEEVKTNIPHSPPPDS